jgi:bifunctional DNA-binding transcriptional regulator/antitoxin component of YhaV-PrlF toxin-antitoxin module
MRQVSVRVEKTGRILIPVEMRRRMNIVEGETEVLLNIDDTDAIRLSTRRQALERIRAELRKRTPPTVSMADELLADRRREALEDDAG